jgi:hypothetical protein
LWVEDTIQHHFIADQFPLPFMTPKRPQIVRLIPKTRYGCLDYGVRAFFSESPSAAKLARKLETKGILYLGQLLQMSEDDVRATGTGDQAAIDAMKRELGRAGLGFDTRAPDWTREYENSCRATRYRHGPNLS